MLVLRGRVYHCRFKFKGTLYQKSLYTANRNEAVTLEAAFRMSVVRGEFGIVDGRRAGTLADFHDRVFAALRTKVKPRSLEYYEDSWNGLVSFTTIAGARLDKIDRNLIEAFVQFRSKTSKPGTVNHNLKTLRRALRLAQEWGVIARVPKITMLPGERQREFVINETVLAVIVESLPEHSLVRHLLPFLLNTGLRLSEALNLRREHVRLEPAVGFARGWVFVAEGKSKFARRYVPLTARAKECLQEALRLSRCDYVWTAGKNNRHKMQRQWVSTTFRTVRDELKLPWDACVHSLRHTFCTNLAEAGVGAFELQKLAGHSSVVISQRYTHMTAKSVESAIDKMEARRAEQADADKKRQDDIPNNQQIDF